MSSKRAADRGRALYLVPQQNLESYRVYQAAQAREKGQERYRGHARTRKHSSKPVRSGGVSHEIAQSGSPVLPGDSEEQRF